MPWPRHLNAGDKMLIGINGYFGLRLVDMAKRYGAEIVTISKPWGEVFSLAEIKAAMEQHKPRIVALVHAETSTGACQPFVGVCLIPWLVKILNICLLGLVNGTAENLNAAGPCCVQVGDLCKQHDAILIADCVTSISGVPLYIDKWGIDAAYAGTQKALSCPPGISPMTFSPRAMKKLMDRKTNVANWFSP
jgi:alanine-glyoxylate transaminase/serine-glyoxylate transaminase/serine-pyruvate transaminase